MSSYIQNYGFTKTLVKDKNNTLQNEIQWQGDYDGKIANIDVEINDNGNKQLINVELDNNDIRQLFGIQPINISLEKRLANDFLYNPNYIALKRKTIRHKKRTNKRNKTNKRNNKNKRNKRTKTNKRNNSLLDTFYMK